MVTSRCGEGCDGEGSAGLSLTIYKMELPFIPFPPLWYSEQPSLSRKWPGDHHEKDKMPTFIVENCFYFWKFLSLFFFFIPEAPTSYPFKGLVREEATSLKFLEELEGNL